MAKAATFIYGLFTNSKGQYIDALGRFVGAQMIRSIIDSDIDMTGERLASLAAQLRAGNISVEDWANAMAIELKHLHLANLAAAKGGVKNLTQSDYGRVGRILRKQYEYLNNFATLLSNNRAYIQTPEFMRRVGFYAQAARTTYETVKLKEEIARGAKWARRVLHNAEHCTGCVRGWLQGWIPASQMVPIGGYECNIHCHCTIEYSYEIERPSLDKSTREAMFKSWRRLHEEEGRALKRAMKRSQSPAEKLPVDARELLKAFGGWGHGETDSDPLDLIPAKVMRRLRSHTRAEMPEVQFTMEMQSARVVDFQIGDSVSVAWNEDAGRIFGNVLSAHSHPNIRPPSGHDWDAILTHSYFRHVAIVGQEDVFVLSRPRNWELPEKARPDVLKRFEEMENAIFANSEFVSSFTDPQRLVAEVMHKANVIMAKEYGLKYRRKRLK